MGVMLSLDRERPAKGRRQGQHVRHRHDDERARPLAAARRYYAPGSGRLRLLSRLARAVLARKDPGGSVRGGSAPAA
jgi:hypothetical protein